MLSATPTRSVYDADGQFLLIEAAQFIPKWLNPDTSSNRVSQVTVLISAAVICCVCVCHHMTDLQVFLYRGLVHIIPKPQSPADILTLPVATPLLSHALQLVRGEAHTVASPEVQEAIRSRIRRRWEGERERERECREVTTQVLLPHQLPTDPAQGSLLATLPCCPPAGPRPSTSGSCCPCTV